MNIYDRKNRCLVEEKEHQDKFVQFLYNRVTGRVLLKICLVRPWLSKAVAVYQKSRFSKRDIVPFIRKHNIDTTHWNVNDFRSFNEFFIRKKNLSVSADPKDFTSIAESKLSVYNVTKDLCLNIKNSKYTVEEIVGNKELAEQYSDGLCLVFRLSANNYHRYLFPDSGKLKKTYKIKGALHTVRPVAAKYKVFSRNSREVSILETENLGKVVQVEVGAMLVGKIRNHSVSSFVKGDEKGYFEYGGSTSILFLNNNVAIDDDIIEQTKKGYEVKVDIGEKIGRICS
ncbi:MAG: phosphatidylserine decarboxylase [Clostridia bacterium]|nr:phosphatidylserine decarboxylase [Clostridia bacterium]